MLAARKVPTLTEFLQDSRMHWIGLVVAVVVMFGIVLWLKRWWHSQELEKHSPERLLMEFRDLHRQGKLSADEYRGVRERLVQKTDQAGRAENSAQGPCADESAGNSPVTPD